MTYKCNMKGCSAQACTTSLLPTDWLRITIEGTGIMRYLIACDRHPHADVIATVKEALDTLPGHDHRSVDRKSPARRAR